MAEIPNSLKPVGPLPAGVLERVLGLIDALLDAFELAYLLRRESSGFGSWHVDRDQPP